jgi:hypothetical protein
MFYRVAAGRKREKNLLDFFVSILARKFYLLRIEEKVAKMKRRING